MILIHKLQDDLIKHLVYQQFHEEDDFLYNLKPIDKENAVKFRTKGFLFTETKIYVVNLKKKWF